MKRKRVEGLYLILDQRYAKRDIVSIAEDAVGSGVDVIQYREKVLSRIDALTVAKKIRDITGRAGVIFIINDDPELARSVDADGVHLGQDDMPVNIARKLIGRSKVIGLSTHSYQEVVNASALDIDYVGFGPIFHSSTKTVSSPVGIAAINRVRGSLSMPIIAIGGINQENVTDVIREGADGIAVISAILSASNIKQAISVFQERIKTV